MLILRRHWVAGGKCDVTLTPALVDIYKKASEQSVSSFTITTRQSGTIIAESLTNSNNVPYFTIDKNSFSHGTTTVTVTGIAFAEGYPTNIGRIIIKCRGGGKQIIDVDYADCTLDVSIDDLIFDDEHGTVTFDVTSTAGGTIDNSHISKISQESSEPSYIHLHASGESVNIAAGQTVQLPQLEINFNTAEERDEALTNGGAQVWDTSGNISESGVTVTTGEYTSGTTTAYKIYVNGSATNNGDSELPAYLYFYADYHSSTEHETIQVPAVGITPKTFNAGTTTITATINENASAGDLGYLVISNSCGATTNVDARKIDACSLQIIVDSSVYDETTNTLKFSSNNKVIRFNVVSGSAGRIGSINGFVSYSPNTFQAGVTQITATIPDNAPVGDLGYDAIQNDCGTNNLIFSDYTANVLSINPANITLDANGTVQNATISSSILSGTITADSGIIISANSFNSGSTTIQVSAAPNSDTNSKNLGVIAATDSQGNTITCNVTQAAASVTPAQYPEGEELIGAGFYGGNVLSTNVIGSISYDDNNKENIANLRLDYQVAFTYLGDERPVRKLRLNASAKPNTLTLSLYITDSNTATTGYDGSNSDVTALGTKLAEVPLTFVSGEYYSTPVDTLLTPITGTTNANTQQVTMDQQGDISNGTWTTLFSFTMPSSVLNALTSGNNIVGVVDNHRTVPGMLTYNNSNSIGGAVGGIFSYDILE